jgi:dCTP deaminase
MIFTDKTILESLDNGEIVITPFNRENIGTNSVDLTLSPRMKTYVNGDKWFYENNVQGKSYFSTKDEDEDLESFHLFGMTNGYFIDSKEQNETREFEIPEEGIILQPGKLYIASTNEYTETWNAVPKIEGKSSIGRLGLFIHVTAGYGDVGFCGQWTLELVATVPLRIYPNMKICQISYHGISEKPNIDYSKKESAKYSGQMGATESKMHENF